MRIFYIILVVMLSNLGLVAQPKTDPEMQQLIAAKGSALVQRVAADAGNYHLQIIYTRIDRDSRNRPSFRNFYFNYDPELYFNPASMVKMPLAFLALEKLATQPQLDQFTAMAFDSSRPWMRPLYADSTSISGKPGIGHFIKKIFLISDNDAYNRLYQYLGQQHINRSLRQKGFVSARISRQFMGLSPEQNRYTNPIRFADAAGKTLLTLPEQFNTDTLDFSRKILLGRGYMNRNDSLVNEPFDFTVHNNISLLDMQQMLQRVMFPESVKPTERFDLRKDDYRFLRYWMSAYPSETDEPKYDTTKFYDSYVKFFFRDSTHRMPERVRVFNKTGWAYGFLTDVSYVADFNNKVEFMLSATLYVNSDGILNDNRYDYDEIGYPFLRQLGQMIYAHELQRKRKHRPDLSAFQLLYGRRDLNDKRPVVKEADN
jgi:hypothetical protein